MGALEDAFIKTVQLVRRLRAEDGCPWDRAHHFRDYLKMLLEEGQELQSALETNDEDEIRGELGDTIWNALYLLVLGEDEFGFKMEEVLNQIREKIISRHPHVFGSEVARSPDEVLRIWQKVKEKEKERRKRRSGPGVQPVHGSGAGVSRQRKRRRRPSRGNRSSS